MIGDNLKVGDYVLLLNSTYGKGTIVRMINDGSDGYKQCFNIELDNNRGTVEHWTDTNDTQLIRRKGTTMQKLNSMLKLLLGADEQTLYKAGFLNGDLKITTEGQEALSSIVLAANKAALVALATEKLAEEKANNA